MLDTQRDILDSEIAERGGYISIHGYSLNEALAVANKLGETFPRINLIAETGTYSIKVTLGLVDISLFANRPEGDTDGNPDADGSA